MLERLSDTLLDAQIHYTRLLSSVKKQPVPSTGTSPRVVILGTGWAAHSLVKIIDLSVLPSVTIISPRNFFFFTPLLSATAVGTIEFRSIVEPIRISNPFVDYFEAFAVDVDPERKVVTCVEGKRDLAPTAPRNEFEVPYDVLVVAVGETTTTFNVAGARQHAYFLKEISDARRLRVKILGTSQLHRDVSFTCPPILNLTHFLVFIRFPAHRLVRKSSVAHLDRRAAAQPAPLHCCRRGTDRYALHQTHPTTPLSLYDNN